MRIEAQRRARVSDHSLTPVPSGLLQRKCVCGAAPGIGAECADCEKNRLDLRRKTNGRGGVTTVPPLVHEVLRSPGWPLDAKAQSFMEARFGHDFGKVRIHTDEKAANSAQAVNALAYTVGKDIVFGVSQYNPHSMSSLGLLAHELVHVIQQRNNAESRHSDLRIGRADEPSEREADFAASQALEGRPISVRNRSPQILSRYSHEDCTASDLKMHIWSADYLAKRMTAKAIRVLSASQISLSVASLLGKYFMSKTPDISEIVARYSKIKASFDGDDYTYECDEDCDANKLGKTYWFWSDIHLCMNTLRGWSNDCIARTIVHEFSHYYAGTDDEAYCKSSCEFSRCPATLSVSDALDNADSYACFAYELFSLSA